MTLPNDAVVVGAGVAGLAAARELERRGARVVVLDKARGVGGRCATWRGPADLPFDYGVTFLHGDDEAFLQAVGEVEGTLVPGWPVRIEGSGDPCQTTAFAPRERRFGVAEGISAFPKTLAHGLAVELQSRVDRLELKDGAVRVHTDGGSCFAAPTVIVALPCEQARDLLEGWTEAAERLAGLRSLLGLLGTLPCLTVMASYPEKIEPPSWDMLYPRESRVLQLCSHESSKRAGASAPGLVLQARASWSGAHLEDDPAAWTQELLVEAGRLIGAWAVHPAWVRSHRWRHGRTDLSSELAEAPLVELAPGVRLGLAGELFARGAGVEAAWASGVALARRIAEGDTP